MNSQPHTGPKPSWSPTPEGITSSNIGRALRDLGLPDYEALHHWSTEDRSRYWRFVVQRLGIRLDKTYDAILDYSSNQQPTRWLVGAKMNITNSCFEADPELTAILYRGPEGDIVSMTYGHLEVLVNRVANGLAKMGLVRGDTTAVVMPMTVEAVAIYLGIIRAGGVVVSIADSFAPEEIEARMKIGGVRLVFTQDVVLRGSKRLSLYDKVIAAHAPVTVVLTQPHGKVKLRDGDRDWHNFLPDNDRFAPVSCRPLDPINILFSSGTTGDPKAIPWDHTTPIKCAADGHFHHDIQPADITCWPTNLGWMMGPWLIFATLINRGTIALYDQTPTETGFGQFVGAARVNMLGVVPSLVRTWRETGCMSNLNWSAIKLFSSTGECSNADDMRFLMSLAGNRPVIEYCGGTEIGGGYVTGTLAQSAIAATFSTPALGLDFVLLDTDGRIADRGEVFLIGPSMGLSTRLLNRDHNKEYYHNTPRDHHGRPLRRHGDLVERLSGGCFRVLGRVDDTMNLGGIKVGPAQIERVLDNVPGVRETAAVAVSPPVTKNKSGGGPSRLVIFVVTDPDSDTDTKRLATDMQQAIRSRLNPLFKIHEVRLVDALPRTASNKVMRRELRAKYEMETST